MNSRQEPIEDAIQKTIKWMDKWSHDNDQDWTEFFSIVECSQIIDQLRSGRVSPWVFFTSEKAKIAMNRMTDEQLMLLDKYLDIKWWMATIRRKPQDRQYVEQIVKEYQI